MANAESRGGVGLGVVKGLLYPILEPFEHLRGNCFGISQSVVHESDDLVHAQALPEVVVEPL